jgi:predicted phosphodiesterase
MSTKRVRLRLLVAATAFAATQASATTLTRGPYLQLLNTRSVTIVWNTDHSADCALSIHALGGSTTVIQGGTGTVCAIPVAGLVAGGRYGYTPLANGNALRSESVFHTPDPTAPLTFLVFGDSGNGSSNQRSVRDRMLNTPADFILHTGDMIYPSGALSDFDPKFFSFYKDLIRSLVLWPCMGNHDYDTSKGQPWRDVFWTPANNAERKESYFSFDYGNAHVAVIDSDESTKPGSAQYEFLDQDLDASSALWKFVAFHHTIYSSTGSNSGIRSNLVPLFDQRDVDIVFMGHVHTYERTKPLRGGRVVSPDEGTVYITTGSGGVSTFDGGTSSFTADAETGFHFVRVAIQGGTLTADMIRTNGSIGDSVTLTKSGGTTTTTQPTTTTTPSTTTTTLSNTTPGILLQLPASADTYVDAGASSSNFAQSTTLIADANPVRVIYLRFDVSGVGAQQVQKAVLRLQVDGVSGSDSSNAGRAHRLLDTSWAESAPTWNSRLAPQASVLVAPAGAVSFGQTVDFDVTGAVTGDGPVGFAIDSTSSDGVHYKSREAQSGTPLLLLTLE